MIDKIKKNLFLLTSTFFLLYFIFNLLDGERGLISYYQKQELKKELIIKNKVLTEKLKDIEKKNSLLTDKIDLDYLETLYREKFMVGDTKEKIYVNN